MKRRAGLIKLLSLAAIFRGGIRRAILTGEGLRPVPYLQESKPPPGFTWIIPWPELIGVLAQQRRMKFL